MKKLSKEIIAHITDTINHKKRIMDSALLMFDYLLSVGEDELAVDLIRRAVAHDNSKLRDIELTMFAKITDGDDEAFTNPDYKLSEDEKKYIEYHWKNNRHHPEYFEDIKDMTELDIIEMVCDWHARSVEYGTDLVEFATRRQENRFFFPEDMFCDILNYCNIILYLEQKKQKKE